MLLRKILRLSLNIKICISKNMALFLKVLTLTPCFSKCKFLRSETVLEFYARHVHCTKSDSLCKSIHFAQIILTSHTHIILISVLSYEKLTIITKKPFILIEYQRISKRENLMKIVLTCAIAHSVIFSRQGKASEGLYLPFNPLPHPGDFNNVHPCHFVTPLILFSLFLAA